MYKFLENLEQAEKILRATDHLIYSVYPLIKEKRILLKSLTEINTAIVKIINAILQYEYLYKRISLDKNSQINFQTFMLKCAPRYEINSDEITQIKELFEITKQHQKSSMEFTRNEKIVILSKDLCQKTISLEKIKEFLNLAKSLLKKIEKQLKEK